MSENMPFRTMRYQTRGGGPPGHWMHFAVPPSNPPQAGPTPFSNFYIQANEVTWTEHFHGTPPCPSGNSGPALQAEQPAPTNQGPSSTGQNEAHPGEHAAGAGTTPEQANTSIHLTSTGPGPLFIQGQVPPTGGALSADHPFVNFHIQANDVVYSEHFHGTHPRPSGAPQNPAATAAQNGIFVASSGIPVAMEYIRK